MNNISFTPNYSFQVSKKHRINTAPTFKGIQQAAKPAKIKEANTFIRKLYDLFFIPFGEKTTRMTDEFVYTKSKSDNGIFTIGRKYNKWSKTPIEIVTDDHKLRIRTRQKMLKNGNCDVVIQDMNTPGYKISVGYDNISDLNNSKYTGDIHLTYCDKKFDITDEVRKNLLSELQKTVDERHDPIINKLLKHDPSVNPQEAIDNFFKDPDVIGAAILRSPYSLNNHLRNVNVAMPYGIERIIEHL